MKKTVLTVVLGLLVGVGVAGCGAQSRGSTSSPAASKPPACFVTGGGQKLCGADARAYCSIQMMGDIDDPNPDSSSADIASMQACLSVGYEPTEAEKKEALVQYGALNGGRGQDPLPPP